MKALGRILGYLIRTENTKLKIGPIQEHDGFQIYADADWAECVDDRKSQSGSQIIDYLVLVDVVRKTSCSCVLQKWRDRMRCVFCFDNVSLRELNTVIREE